MNQSDQKPSHILVYADETYPPNSIKLFCTNVKNENPETGFTYLCHNSSDNIRELSAAIDSYCIDPKSLFVISEPGAAIHLMKERGIACAELGDSITGRGDLRRALYCIENIESVTYKTIVRMWQRDHGIPWTIAETDRLVIREQMLSDIPALYEVYADEDATRYMEDLYEDPQDEEKYLADYINNQYRFYEYGIWAVVLKEDGKLIGRAGISMREGFDIPEIGYIIGSKYRNRGYAKEALAAVIDHAYKELGMDELIAFTKEENAPSVLLLKGLGFVMNGHEDIRGGRHAMYSLTKQ